MKMKYLLVVIFIKVAITSFSQGGAPGDLVSSGSNAWIFHTPDDGRTTLHIAPYIDSNWHWGKQTYFKNDGGIVASGNIHIPLLSTIGHLQETDRFNHNGNWIGNYSVGWANDSWLSGAPTGYISAYGGLKIFTHATPRFVVNHSGNVGIGTTNPQQKLHVNGTVYSTEVKVDVAAGQGPDYVFADNYQLPSLAEIKSYIDQHKHLPEVPSAKEMEANGVNLGEMNLLLLKKIEELTLYVIELKEENKAQAQEIQKIKQLK